MKLITMALVCLLLAAMWPQDVTSKSMHVPSARCCFDFLERLPSQKLIRCYRNTSPTCSHPAVIFRLKKGQESCALSSKVQDYLKKLKPC
ncbi:C-C motif chemokine 1 [Peromyscus californicus insignis]|uniref:C-C motif chemokine 1 n=1 Tax=Peromyscus californicus insignis TaxID=564181 RepID=UPI0022A70FD3|nr:C-C motif chemokine 1 [Peromyscus californicus insignis]